MSAIVRRGLILPSMSKEVFCTAEKWCFFRSREYRTRDRVVDDFQLRDERLLVYVTRHYVEGIGSVDQAGHDSG
jgi:hypothetical protein